MRSNSSATVVILSRGRVAAAGRPHELTRAGGIEVHTGTGVRRFPDESRDDTPGIVASLVREGALVYEVRVLSPAC